MLDQSTENALGVSVKFKQAIEKNKVSKIPHIIIVDDELLNRRALEEHISNRGYVVTSCKNGLEVLELLNSDHSLNDIRLVLLDVVLPDVSGFDVCEQIRKKYDTNQLPILFLTAQSGFIDIEKGYDVGGNDYLKKPISKNELTLRMNMHLEFSEIHQGLEQAVKQRTKDLEVSNKNLVESNQKLMELQGYLVQSEKMSSLGTLVSGVGHEINNPVNFINASAHNLKQDIESLHGFLVDLAGDDPDDEIIHELTRRFTDLNATLTAIDDGVVRVNSVVSNLRTFSRSGGKTFAVETLCAGIVSTLNLVKAKYKDHIEFITDFGSDALVSCNASEINQVIMNLTVNACQAMENNEEGNVRRVIIKTSDDGERFIVEVSDTGTGIKDNILHKIFDPFFTTKPDGQGTGLGLSISHGIIRRHHGDLTVSSELGVGSLFKIVLPIAK